MNLTRRSEKPPAIAERILRWILPLRDREYLLGDFESVFRSLKKRSGSRNARIWYWSQVFKTMPGFFSHRISLRIALWTNQAKMAVRNMRHHPGYSFAHLGGLAVGMAICLIMILWIRHELSFNRFHANAERVYRVVLESHAGSQVTKHPTAPTPLIDVVKETLLQIETSAHADIITGFWTVKSGDRFIEDVHILVTESALFQMLDFKWIQGNVTVMEDRDAVVLTQRLAKAIFGNQDPLGETLVINRNPSIVKGLIQDPPANSTLQFDCIIPFTVFRDVGSLMTWEYGGFGAYMMLQENANLSQVNERLTEILRANIHETQNRCYLQSILDIHLHSSDLQYDEAVLGDLKTVTILSITAGIVFLIACINYVGLSTARSMRRAREVGIRKVMGARRGMMMRQFLLETLILVSLVMILSMAIVALALDWIQSYMELRMTLDLSVWIELLPILIVMVLATGLLAGFYPAIVLSSFRPSSVLKGLPFSGSSKVPFRRILVGFQFFLTAGLLFSTVVIHNQLRYINDKDLGYQPENIIVLDVLGDFYYHFNERKNQLLQNPNILHVAQGFEPIYHRIQTVNPFWEGKELDAPIQSYWVGYDYFQTWGMQILEGRGFLAEYSTDSLNILVNETAARILGLKQAIGKHVTIEGQTGQVIGIVKDFHHASLHHPIEPIVFRLRRSMGFAVKLKSMDQETLNFIKNIWDQAVPNRPFENDVFHSRLSALYEKEKNIVRVFDFFTLLAMGVGCLGLFGLAAYVAESRTREIGIRKALGASTSRLFFQISWEFLGLVAISSFAVWPIAWDLMSRWLEQFAYKTKIEVWIFPVILGMLSAAALAAVAYQALRVAMANPVEALHHE